MPFDGKNFQQTKPNVFSLEGLVAWLETQDPLIEYNYGCVRRCVLGVYTLAMGGQIHGGAAGYVIGDKSLPCTIMDGLPIDLWKTVSPSPATLGAALSRARQLLAERP